MDQIDEEQDNNFKISAQKRALDAELSDVKASIELLEASLKTVRKLFLNKQFILFRELSS